MLLSQSNKKYCLPKIVRGEGVCITIKLTSISTFAGKHHLVHSHIYEWSVILHHLKTKHLLFKKSLRLKAKRQHGLDVLDIFLDWKWVFGLTSYYDLGLIPGTMIGHYNQVVLFIYFYYEKVWNIYKRFEGKTNTWTCKVLRLGSSIRTSIRHYTQIAIFF